MCQYLKTAGFYLFLLLITGSCTYAQTEETSSPKPKVQIKVNKETDEHGNIIRYDSTYVWSWSNMDSSGSYELNDSVFANFFDNRKNRFHLFFNDSDFFVPFSMPSFDFFEDDFSFFDKQMEALMQRHKEMIRQHEELMKRFFEPQPLIPAPQQPKSKSPSKPQKNSTQEKTQNHQQGIDM